jgi:hypothetical protein
MTKTKPRILIYCNGVGEKWDNYLGIPKQLIPLGNTTLLQRTIDLARKYSDDILIVSWDARLVMQQAGFHRIDQTGWLSETLLKTRSLWRGRTVWLLGDVFYTPGAMRRILRCQEPIRFFGRMEPHLYFGGKKGELFGASFSEGEYANLENAIQVACQDAREGGRGKLWQVYRSRAGIPLKQHTFVPGLLERVSDLTDDIDSPEEYHIAIPVLSMAANPSLGGKIKLFAFIASVWVPDFWRRVRRKAAYLLKLPAASD